MGERLPAGSPRTAGRHLSRRSFLQVAGAAAVGGAVAKALRVVDTAFEFDPLNSGSVADIDHFVLLMQENRSYDHYFAARTGTATFTVDTLHDAGLSLDDPCHDWATQHRCRGDADRNGWLEAHRTTDKNPHAVLLQYTRTDIPVHYSLAEAFLSCDRYFCSVLGPTAPNRLYWMSGQIDPLGTAGGPLVGPVRPADRFAWPTFPQLLEQAGVSWKIYSAAAALRTDQLSGLLEHFPAAGTEGMALHDRGRAPLYPADFVRDVRLGRLPAVSWLIPAMHDSEHPLYGPPAGARLITEVMTLLLEQPALWERTALIVSYDENGGFYDHVVPPSSPLGDPLETVDGAPIGLGFRVPCLVISPYTRGGRLSSTTFDHTSQLRMLCRRFGIPESFMTDWRTRTVGDLGEVFGWSNGAVSATR